MIWGSGWSVLFILGSLLKVMIIFFVCVCDFFFFFLGGGGGSKNSSIYFGIMPEYS